MEIHELKQERTPKKKRSHYWAKFLSFWVSHPRIVIILVLLVILLTASLGLSYSSSISSRMVRFGMRDVGELTTQVGFFTNVQTIENSRKAFGWDIPLKKTKCIFSYDGTVSAGIDFSEIDVDMNKLGKKISVKLPEAEIFGVEIDPESMQIYDESKSIFTPLNLSDVNDSINQLKANVRNQAIENGILENAEKNAILLIQNMLSSCVDTSAYTIEFV